MKEQIQPAPNMIRNFYCMCRLLAFQVINYLKSAHAYWLNVHINRGNLFIRWVHFQICLCIQNMDVMTCLFCPHICLQVSFGYILVLIIKSRCFFFFFFFQNLMKIRRSLLYGIILDYKTRCTVTMVIKIQILVSQNC